MGFFDEYKDSSSSTFVKADEKAQLIEDGTPFPIIAIAKEDHSEFGERFNATVLLPGDEGDVEKTISFPTGSVESRDRMLEAMEKFLDDPTNTPPVVVLYKKGRSILLRAAD